MIKQSSVKAYRELVLLCEFWLCFIKKINQAYQKPDLVCEKEFKRGFLQSDDKRPNGLFAGSLEVIR